MRSNNDFNGNGFSEPADGDRFSRIFGGFVIPAILAIIGMLNIVTQCAHIRFNTITGAEAVLWGSARMSLGALLHAHYYWTVSEKLWRYSLSAIVISSAAFVLTI